MRDTERTAALAGVTQAAALVHQLAHSADLDDAALDTTLGTIFRPDAADSRNLFLGLGGLEMGFAVAAHLLGRNLDTNTSIIGRYALALLRIERRLAGRRQLHDELDQGITRIARQVEFFGGIRQRRVIANLGDLYTETAGQLKPRIMVRGDAGRLQDPANVDLIRATLLGGLRAARLWRQQGGSVWTLLFGHRRLQREALRLSQI